MKHPATRPQLNKPSLSCRNVANLELRRARPKKKAATIGRIKSDSRKKVIMEDKLALNDKLEATDEIKELAKLIAMEIGKSTAFHISQMYPEAVQATSSTFLLSVRNHVYNEIMNIREEKFGMNVAEWIADRGKHRRILRKLSKARTIEEVKQATS